MSADFSSFKDFYPFYLAEHSHQTSRRLHYIGTSLSLVLLVYCLVSGKYSFLWSVPLTGYAFAWIGHSFFEKNKPATFKHPIYSLCGDFVMLKDMLTGKIKF